MAVSGDFFAMVQPYLYIQYINIYIITVPFSDSEAVDKKPVEQNI